MDPSRGNQNKMKSYGWTLIQYDKCSYKKRRVDTDMYTDIDHWTDEIEPAD